jgi:adenine-specific DNA-methyltransferase
MPTLNWIGKEAVVNHDKEVPFRLLKKVKAHSVGDSQNLIIKGDNLEGLKALMPYYIGKVKCIYIDPPYNTGNENWVYNDKVNSPKIKKWLGKVVGGEAQDLCRHDKWLCMMYPRLKLLRDLLSEDGVIFISIDDWEIHNLRPLMNEVFGEENFINCLIWRKNAGASNDSKYFGVEHEYILCYGKDKNKVNRFFTQLTDKHRKEYKHKDEHFEEWGAYKKYNLYQPGIDENRPNLRYVIEAPDGSKIDIRPRIWRWSKERFLEAKENGEIDFVKNKKTGEWGVFTKIYMNKGDDERRIKPRSILMEQGFTLHGNRELKEIFSEKPFSYPKPSSLIKYLIEIITNEDKDSIILDSFAGSGTTGHAVLDLNKEDGGNRKFILIEMEDDIAKKITAERIKRAIEKYGYKDGFEYCELDKPLFDENGQIEETCDFNQFATYIYFTETQTNIDKKQIDKNFIGEKGEVEYYLVYKEKYKNVLDKGFLSKLKKTKYKKIIYADFCMIDEDELKIYNIQFKQIPYEVKVY